MSATTLAAFIALAAGYASGIWFVVAHLGARIDRLEKRVDLLEQRIEDRLDRIDVTLARIAQQLDDHIQDHPGPTQRLTSSR